MSLSITRVNTPEWLVNIKCPYTMAPTRIVVHNTANKASAMSEVSYMLNNTNEVSYHFAVDYERAVQGLPLNRNGWHAGDGGNGVGNRQGIAIEICHSTGNVDDFIRSENNGALLVAMLLKQYGWGVDKVTKHQDYSGKYCPHKTLDMGWARFLGMVQAELDALNGKTPADPQPTPPEAPKCEKYGEGTAVCVNRIWTQSIGGQSFTGDWSGKITKVIPGAEHPYLIDGGNIGWTNDEAIDTDPHVPGEAAKPAPEPIQPNGPKYGVGTKVTYTGLWTASNGGAWYPKGGLLVKQGIITKVVPGAEHPYLISDGIGWANDKCIDDEPSVYR